MAMGRGINPALSARQPDNSHAGRYRHQTGHAQRIFWRRQNLRGQPLGKCGKPAIDQALDDEDKAYGGKKVQRPDQT